MSDPEILLISAGYTHPPLKGRNILRGILQEFLGEKADSVRTLEQAAKRGMGRYKAVVLYFHHKSAVLPVPVLSAFDSYIRSGGAVLALHSATASYKKNPGYFDILGGRFIGHGPVETFEIKPAETAPGPFTGIEDFSVTDELYLHEHSAPIQTHMVTEFQGKQVPMVWTREHGSGRICYLCPGHRAESLEHPAMNKLINRGLNWVLKR